MSIKIKTIFSLHFSWLESPDLGTGVIPTGL